MTNPEYYDLYADVATDEVSKEFVWTVNRIVALSNREEYWGWLPSCDAYELRLLLSHQLKLFAILCDRGVNPSSLV